MQRLCDSKNSKFQSFHVISKPSIVFVLLVSAKSLADSQTAFFVTFCFHITESQLATRQYFANCPCLLVFERLKIVPEPYHVPVKPVFPVFRVFKHIVFGMPAHHGVEDRGQLLSHRHHGLKMTAPGLYVPEVIPRRPFDDFNALAHCLKTMPMGFGLFGTLLDSSFPLDILLFGTRFAQLTKRFASANLRVKSAPSSATSFISEARLIPGRPITFTPQRQ